MIKDTYALYRLNDLLFSFHSEGIQGKILKIVIFTLQDNGKWNLAFGDWKDKNLDDKVMSNNEDVVRVIGTVAKAAYKFFENHPDATLEIKPVDEKRRRLYNIVFQRHFYEIAEKFQIIGIIGEQKENYSPEKLYNSFELTVK